MSLTPIALEIDQGDDERLNTIVFKAQSSWVDQDVPEVADLTGCTLTWKLRTSASQAPILTKVSTDVDEIEVADQGDEDTKGHAQIKIDKADTVDLAVNLTGRTLRWELDVLDTGNKTTTLARGSMIINRNVAGT